MLLMFSPKEILNRGIGLTFDDVLLVPRYSEVSSRKHPVLKTKITKNEIVIIKTKKIIKKYK